MVSRVWSQERFFHDLEKNETHKMRHTIAHAVSEVRDASTPWENRVTDEVACVLRVSYHLLHRFLTARSSSSHPFIWWVVMDSVQWFCSLTKWVVAGWPFGWLAGWLQEQPFAFDSFNVFNLIQRCGSPPSPCCFVVSCVGKTSFCVVCALSVCCLWVSAWRSGALRR